MAAGVCNASWCMEAIIGQLTVGAGDKLLSDGGSWCEERKSGQK